MRQFYAHFHVAVVIPDLTGHLSLSVVIGAREDWMRELTCASGESSDKTSFLPSVSRTLAYLSIRALLRFSLIQFPNLLIATEYESGSGSYQRALVSTDYFAVSRCLEPLVKHNLVPMVLRNLRCWITKEHGNEVAIFSSFNPRSVLTSASNRFPCHDHTAPRSGAKTYPIHDNSLSKLEWRSISSVQNSR